MRLTLAASLATMASGVAAARLTAAPDSILTFNRTVSLSSGLFQWFPKGEFGPVSDGVTVWTVSYSGIPGGGTGWNNAKVGEGNPIYQYSAPSIRGYTPGVTVELPIEAIYYEGDFVPWNGDDPNMLIIKKNQDDPTRMTLPGYVRYYDNIPKFQQNELYFGVDDGIKGGGNFTVRNVTMTMSIISTYASWEAAQAGAQIVPLYSPGPTGGRHESVVDCLNCQNFADETARGAGYDYYNVGWYINNTDAYFTIKVPPSTTLFELYGATGLKYGRMAVEWDPPLPEDMASAPYVNTHSMWLQYEQLLVMQPLDPRIEYKVTLKNAALMENDPNYNAIDSGATDISVSRYQFFRATEAVNYGNDTNTEGAAVRKSSSNMGAVIGGAVGGVLGALCIAALALWLWIQHRRKNNVRAVHKGSKSEFDIDDPNVTPFVNANGASTASIDGDNRTMSEIPSSSAFSRSGANTGTADTESQGWSDEGLLSPSTGAGFGQAGGSSSTKSAAITPSSARGSRAPRREVVNEMDAGVLEPIEDQVEYEYVPPLYNPEWAQTSASGRSNSSTGPYSPTNPSTVGASTMGDNSQSGGGGYFEMSNMSTPMVEEPNPTSPTDDTDFHDWYTATNSSAMLSPTSPRAQNFGN